MGAHGPRRAWPPPSALWRPPEQRIAGAPGCGAGAQGTSEGRAALGRERGGGRRARWWSAKRSHGNGRAVKRRVESGHGGGAAVACQPPTGNPPPVPARKTQRSGATFRRAVFSAKEVPGAQDLSPRVQTHLPFGCSVVGVMWKPKASLNLQKKNFHLSVCPWFLISCMSESATGPVVYALICRLPSVGSNPINHPPKSLALFVTWL